MQYAVSVFNVQCSPWYDTQKEADDAIKLLSEAHKAIAEIIIRNSQIAND